MYNLYINTTASENKGSFKIDYRHKPLNFEQGSKIAFNNMLMYNSINNISANIGNNVIYILAQPSSPSPETITTDYQPDYGELPMKDDESDEDNEGFYKVKFETTVKDYPEFNDVFVKYVDDGSYRIYKIVLPDGQYSIDVLDEEIAMRLAVDIDSTSKLHTIKDEESRVFMITAEPTFGKVKFMIDNHQVNGTLTKKFDIVFPVNNFNLEKSIAKFLGIHTMNQQKEFTTGTTGDGTNSEFWYSFNESSPDTSGYAFTKADVNNGITSLNIRVAGSLFNGGYDSLSAESDIIHSFNITAAPGYPQDVSPNHLVFLDIVAVNRTINYLDFRITDQNGREIGTDITEDWSMVLTVKEPQDN